MDEQMICLETFHLGCEDRVAPPLKARDYKDPLCVCYWDGSQTAGTLTANNANGAQRMPDKENFNCVIEVIAIDRAAFNQGENAKYDFSVSGGGIAQTITARGPGAVCCQTGSSEPYATMTTSSRSSSR